MTTSIRLPSLGFVGLIAVYTAVTLFFAWGFSTPDLDRVWRLHHELKIGKEMSTKDHRIVEAAMSRHPQLADALLVEGRIGIVSAHDDGWIETPTATIVRTAASKSDRVMLDVQTPPDLLPYTIHLSASGYERALRVEKHGSYEIALPPANGQSSLITLSLEGEGFRADPSVLGVRVGFCCEQQPFTGAKE